MQRATITLIVLLIFNNCFSQTFKNYEIKRLKTFEINRESIELNSSANYLDFKAILEKEQKRKTNKTLAIILTSLSALTMTYGAKIITNSKGDQEGLGGSIGIMIMTAGVVELGVSIPLYISSNKRKKERDNLIESLNSIINSIF